MIRISILLIFASLLLAGCTCRGSYCGFELPGKPSIQWGDSRSAQIQYVRGMSDGNRGNPNWTQLAPNLFKVSSYGFDTAYAEQERADWCWVAAVSMVLNYQSIDVTQCDIVERLGKNCESRDLQLGSVSDVVLSMNGWDVNIGGRASAVQATTLAVANGTSLISDVSTNWPVIVGLKGSNDRPGHVYVLTAIEYSWQPGTWNQPVFWEVQLYNPWPGEGVEWMDGREFSKRIRFAARMRVRHF